MNEQPDSTDEIRGECSEYLTWLQSLQVGDRVAVEGKYGLEIGEINFVGVQQVALLSTTSGHGFYTFWKTADRPGDEQPKDGYERRLVPLTPEREAQDAERTAHHKKAAVLSATDWGRQPGAVVDAVLAAFEGAKEGG